MGGASRKIVFRFQASFHPANRESPIPGRRRFHTQFPVALAIDERPSIFLMRVRFHWFQYRTLASIKFFLRSHL